MRETERERADERNQMTRRDDRDQTTRRDHERQEQTRDKRPFSFVRSTCVCQRNLLSREHASTNSMIDPPTYSCQQYNQAVMTQADIIACADSSLAVTVT